MHIGNVNNYPYFLKMLIFITIISISILITIISWWLNRKPNDTAQGIAKAGLVVGPFFVVLTTISMVATMLVS